MKRFCIISIIGNFCKLGELGEFVYTVHTDQYYAKNMSVFFTVRRWVYLNLHDDNYRSFLSTCINYFLITLIVANVGAVILESVQPLYKEHQFWFNLFENISITVFTLEYLLRFWSVVEKDRSRSEWAVRWQWVRSGGAIIDLLAILPAFLNFFVHVDLRVLRIFRLLRLLKLTRYFVSLQMLLRVIQRERGAFQAVVFILSIMIVMAASGIYIVENKAQPEAFSSIPKAMWWAVVTLTTVGYGDVTPITPMGKFLGALITILGVGIAALPAGILASGLANELNQRNQRLELEFLEMLQQQGLDIFNDQDELEKLRQRVGLTKEQMHDVIIQLMRERQYADHQGITCPHCGKGISIQKDDRDE